MHWFDPASRQKESKQTTDLTQQAGRKNQSRWTSKLFNQPQWSTTKSFRAGALICPSKQAERIKAEEQASYSTIHNGRLRKASVQVHWFAPASRQKESKQKNKQVIQPSTIGRLRKASKQVHWFDPASRQKESKQNMQVIQASTTVDYEKLPNRCTDLTQQAGRKNQSRRTSKLFNHPQWSTTKSFRAGALICPSKQAERIKAKEQARFSTIHNGPLRNASKQVHWFDPVIRQKESKQMNKRVIQPSTTVDYEKIPNRSTDLSQQAGRKNHSRRLFLTSKQAERIKAEEHASYSTIHNGRLRKASKQVHWFDPGSRQKELKKAERIKAEDWFDPASRQKLSKEKNMQVIQPSTMGDNENLPRRCTDLIQEAGRKN